MLFMCRGLCFPSRKYYLNQLSDRYTQTTMTIDYSDYNDYNNYNDCRDSDLDLDLD